MIALTPEDNNKRLEAKYIAFRADLDEIKKKHGLDLIASLQYHDQGVLPVVRLIEKDYGTINK